MSKSTEAQPPEASGTPSISVVIPCFNASRYIARTLESVLAQTWRDFELIVVDDRSTDESPHVVQRFVEADARVRLIRRDSNAGAPAAPRNTGVRAARGDWIAFLDADDLWHPQKLALQMQALRATGAAMCSTRMKDFRVDSEIVFTEPGQQDMQGITWRMQLRKYRTPTSSIVARRSLMLRHPFNEDLRYKAREDTDCFTRVHEEIGTSIKLLSPLMFYRQQSSQISGNKWSMIGRHLTMLRRYERRDGRTLGLMAYVYTFTHFVASVYLRSIRRML